MKVIKVVYCAYIAVFMINGGCSYSKNSASDKQSYNSSHLLLALTHLSNTMEHSTVSVGEQLSDWNLNAPLMKAIFGKYPTFRENIIELKKKGIGVIKVIVEQKKQLIKKAGHGINPHTHSILTPLEVKEVERYMITEKQAYHLEKSLNDYVRFLNDAYKPYGIPRLPLIAEGNAKNPLYEHQPAKQKLDFAHAYFAHTTAIMALSYLTHFQNIVLRYEEEVMKYMILSLVDKR